MSGFEIIEGDVTLYDKDGNPVKVTLDGSDYKLDILAKLLASTAEIGKVRVTDGTDELQIQTSGEALVALADGLGNLLDVLVDGAVRRLAVDAKSVLHDDSGTEITSTADAGKTRLDVSSKIVGQSDAADLDALHSIFGDTMTADRLDFITASFVFGRQPSITALGEQWDLTGVSGTFGTDELVDGSNTDATGRSSLGFILDVGPSPAVLLHIDGPDFQDGDNITGRESAATATINANSRGRVSFANSLMTVSTNTDSATGKTYAQSRKVAPYIAGHDGIGIMTCRFPDGGAAGVLLGAGMFTESGNGYRLVWNGAGSTDQAIQVIRGGSVSQTINRTGVGGWDDPADGTGASGYNADFTKPQILRIQHGYLGAAGAVVYLMTDSLSWIPIHKVSAINSTDFPIILDPHLPVCFVAEKTSAVAGTYRVQCASFNAGSIGPPEIKGRTHSYKFSEFMATGEQYCFSIRNKRTFNGVSNTNLLKLRAVTISSDGRTEFDILRNVRLTSPAWVDHHLQDSFAEVDIAATAHADGDAVVPFAKVNDGEHYLVEADDIELLPGESLTFLVTNNGNRSVIWGVNWVEYL